MKKRIGLFVILCCVLLNGCMQQDIKVEEQVIMNDHEKPCIVSFINVGKGDAFLIDVPDDGYYLCDTGKEQDFATIARVLALKNVNHINGIFLSHGHLDHVGNVENILKNYTVDKIYISNQEDPSYRKFPIKEIVSHYDVELVELHSHQHLQFHDLGVDVWIPPYVDKKNENNNSVVLKMTYGNNAILMSGDMELEEESTFLFEHKDLQCDILKLGHHGEKDATSIALLEKVQPKYGIITGNAKENPQSVNKTIKKRLEEYGVHPFYSEGNQLSIDFISTKNNIKIRYFYDQHVESDVRIEELNIDEDYVSLKNNGTKAVNLSHYHIRSKKGEEWFTIPEGTMIRPNQEVYIKTLDCDKEQQPSILWKEEDVWDDDDKEAVVLYDAHYARIDKKEGVKNYE